MAQTLLARTGLERVPLEFLGAGYLLSYATAVSAAKRWLCTKASERADLWYAPFCRNRATLGRSPCDPDSTWPYIVAEVSQVSRARSGREAKHSHAFQKRQIVSQGSFSWLGCSGLPLPNTSFMLECHINWFLIEQCASNFQNPAEYKTEEVRLLLFGFESHMGKDTVHKDETLMKVESCSHTHFSAPWGAALPVVNFNTESSLILLVWKTAWSWGWRGGLKRP